MRQCILINSLLTANDRRCISEKSGGKSGRLARGKSVTRSTRTIEGSSELRLWFFVADSNQDLMWLQRRNQRAALRIPDDGAFNPHG
jgi:hypothetical protein